MGEVPTIRLRGIAKGFSGFQALKGVDLEAWAGEVHALLGDNGAGKSTLIKILSGVLQPSAGSIEIDGRPTSFASPADATLAGIGTVFQDLSLIPLLSVARNFFMGREIKKGPKALLGMDRERMGRIALDQMAAMGIALKSAAQPVGTLSGGQRQTLAIARAVYFGARVLILDEPTSALGQKQQLEVLKTIKRVRDRGDTAIILVTHNEVHARLIADRFTFMSLGEVIASGHRDRFEEQDIRRLMAGGAALADLEKELARG